MVSQGTMEGKIYKKHVAKEGLATRVGGKKQGHRFLTKKNYSFNFIKP